MSSSASASATAAHSRVIPIPSPAEARVLREQFDLLFDHWTHSHMQPEKCGGHGGACQNCVRFIRIRAILLAPFQEKR